MEKLQEIAKKEKIEFANERKNKNHTKGIRKKIWKEE